MKKFRQFRDPELVVDGSIVGHESFMCLVILQVFKLIGVVAVG